MVFKLVLGFKTLLMLLNPIRQPYVFSVQRSREYASREPYKWLLPLLSLSLFLPFPFFQTYYFAEAWQKAASVVGSICLRIWSQRIITLSPDIERSTVHPFLIFIRELSAYIRKLEAVAYKNIDRVQLILLPARKNQTARNTITI